MYEQHLEELAPSWPRRRYGDATPSDPVRHASGRAGYVTKHVTKIQSSWLTDTAPAPFYFTKLRVQEFVSN